MIVGSKYINIVYGTRKYIHPDNIVNNIFTRKKSHNNKTAITFHKVNTRTLFTPSIKYEDMKHQIEKLMAVLNVVDTEKYIKENRNKELLITYDDIDELSIEGIKKISSELRIPVTIFITTSRIEGGNEWMWTDAVTAIIKSKNINKINRLTMLLQESNAINNAKIAKFFIKNTDLRIIDEVLDIAGNYLENYPKLLNEKMLKDLTAKNNLIQIGCHTTNHFSLARLSSARIEEEITKSKQSLEKYGGKIEAFAYPYGGRNDYDGRVIKVLEKNKIRAAFTTDNLTYRYKGEYKKPRISFNEIIYE